MTVAATVEQIEGERFRAEASISIPLSVEASSRDQALEALREEATKHLNGEEIVIKEGSPWARFAGSWCEESDGEFEAYWNEVLAFRRDLDCENQMGAFAAAD